MLDRSVQSETPPPSPTDPRASTNRDRKQIGLTLQTICLSSREVSRVSVGNFCAISNRPIHPGQVVDLNVAYFSAPRIRTRPPIMTTRPDTMPAARTRPVNDVVGCEA